MSNLLQLDSFRQTESENIYGYIQVYFNRIKQESENTALTYRKAIEDFFLSTRNKRLEELLESDLSFSMRDVEIYQTELRKTLKASTVNTKMTAIKKLMDKLEAYELKVNAKVFDVDRYTQHDSVGYDPMTTEEVLESIEIVSNTRKGLEKALFIKLAFSTAFRKESIQNLKWSDVQLEKDVWTVKTLGKGNVWDKKKLPNSLYDELMEFKKTVGDRDKIFTLSKSTIDGMMNLIRKEINFGERRIVFHSLKKSSIEETGLRTNYDLKAMQLQGNHANVTTTLNSYLSARKFEDMVIVDLDEKINLDPLNELTREELINLIKSVDRATQIKLLKQLED